MRTLHLFPVLLLLVAFGAATAQNDDELPIADEKDNQFPPSEPELGVIEGSGDAILDEPLDVTTESVAAPELNLIEPILDSTPEDTKDETICPEICTCSVEGESGSINFIVDCSSKDLQDLPSDLDSKTTTLNLQYNKLTEIPQSISALKNLKVLIASDNSIMELSPGSVSELPELKILKLENNRLLEYPQELKNSFSLTNLEELYLSGNDMRSTLTTENFSNFQSLRKLTLPSTVTDISESLCDTLRSTLETVCLGSCNEHTLECPDAPEDVGDEFIKAEVQLPGTIALSNAIVGNADPVVENADAEENEISIDTDKALPDTTFKSDTTESDITSPVNDAIIDSGISEPGVTSPDELNVKESEVETAASSDVSLRSRVISEPPSESSNAISSPDIVADIPKEAVTDEKPEVKVGATTSSTPGGVDKSVIGLVVAGMVVVVAGITIKKNWSSIKKKFSSSPRPANGNANTNGSTPEEVPLKEKSPV